MAGVFRIISRVTVLAVAVRESGGPHGGMVVASPGSPSDVLTAGSACSGTSGNVRRYHDSLFAGHLGVCWPGLHQDVRSYLVSSSVLFSPEVALPAAGSHGTCRGGSTVGSGGHGYSGHVRFKGNRYVLVVVDCFSRWTEACPLPNETALAIADAFFQLIVCRFGMPAVIHSDQGQEFDNHLMQELCLLGGAHMTRTTPYHPASD